MLLQLNGKFIIKKLKFIVKFGFHIQQMSGIHSNKPTA